MPELSFDRIISVSCEEKVIYNLPKPSASVVVTVPIVDLVHQFQRLYIDHGM